MVVRNSVTFSVTQIDSQLDRRKSLNYIRTGEHLLVSSSKMARHMSSVHHNWSLTGGERAQNCLQGRGAQWLLAREICYYRDR